MIPEAELGQLRANSIALDALRQRTIAELQGQLREARESANNWKLVAAHHTEEITKLAAQVQELQEDKERMDWLERTCAELKKGDKYEVYVNGRDLSYGFSCDSYRVCIARARKVVP